MQIAEETGASRLNTGGPGRTVCRAGAATAGFESDRLSEECGVERMGRRTTELSGRGLRPLLSRAWLAPVARQESVGGPAAHSSVGRTRSVLGRLQAPVLVCACTALQFDLRDLQSPGNQAMLIPRAPQPSFWGILRTLTQSPETGPGKSRPSIGGRS